MVRQLVGTAMGCAIEVGTNTPRCTSAAETVVDDNKNWAGCRVGHAWVRMK